MSDTATEQPEDREEEDLRELKRHTAMLMEHFDTVQIFATRHIGDDGTISVQNGDGNWFARHGQVATWLLKQDEATRNEVRGE